MKPSLPDVDDLVDDLTTRLPSADRSVVWQVKGPAAAGKSAVLRRLADAARNSGLQPVLVAPPQREEDAAQSALIDAFAGLKLHVNGHLAPVLSVAATWDEKLSAVRDTLEKHRDKLLLLIDEPTSWAPRAWGDFPSRHEEVIDALVRQPHCLRVVTGELPAGLAKKPQVKSLRPRSNTKNWMHDAASWGAMADAAAALERECGTKLADESPLFVRLVVALATVADGHRAVAVVNNNASRRSIAKELIDAIDGKEALEALRAICVRLSLVRRAFDRAVLDAMDTRSLGEPARSILMHGLLFEDGDHYFMHDLVRLDIRAKANWWGDGDDASAHAVIGNALQARRKNTIGPAAFPLEYEEFHHQARAGDAATATAQPFFVEQLLERARALSVRGQERNDDSLIKAAIDLYSTALDSEPSAYAFHYLAYNLDLLGQDQQRVGCGYQLAIVREPRHAWWHSRYVRFLITRGRMLEARRAWDAALDALEIPSPATEPRAYMDLHGKVARLLIHRGQFDFAAEVIEQIPTGVGDDIDSLRAILRDRLYALDQARRGGALFPLSIPKAHWWAAPHKLAASIRHGKRREKLKKWFAGRVEHVSASAVSLVVAAPPRNGAEPALIRIEMSVAEFNESSRDGDVRDLVKRLEEGFFIEIGEYGSEKRQIIRAHVDAFADDERLPPLSLDPDRYLREAGLT